jgi:hypothetical protein
MAVWDVSVFLAVMIVRDVLAVWAAVTVWDVSTFWALLAVLDVLWLFGLYRLFGQY